MHARPAFRRLGLLNGLLIGLALGLGAWGPELLRVVRLPLPLAVPTLLLGLVLLMLLGAIVGWLSARLAHPAATVVLWAIAGVVTILVIAYLPFFGRSLVVWLADSRFWGRVVYPYTLGGTISGLLLGGLMIILVLAVLSLFQNHRLEGLVNEVGERRLPNGRAWLSLLLPLPIVFLASMLTANMITNPSAMAARLTHRAISRAQTYEGDLRQLPPEAGISYGGLRPVQDRIAGPFTLGIADVNAETSIVTVAAHFDSGAWVHCQVINDQLNFCYDAGRMFVDALQGLAAGAPPPTDCNHCTLEATDEAAAWLAEHRAAFGPQPAVSRLASWGNAALMRLEGPDGFAAECWIEGVAPAVLTSCAES
jgi:hypothetical protein